MVRAFKLWRPAIFVKGQSQTQRRHAQTVENATGFDVTIRLRVPLWQHHDGGARFSSAFPASRKQTGAHEVVFRIRCLNRAGPGQYIAAQLPIVNLGKRVKVLAVGHCLRGMCAQNGSRVSAVRMVADELQTPAKRSHKPVVVSLCVRNLTSAHPSSEQNYSPWVLQTGRYLLQIAGKSS